GACAVATNCGETLGQKILAHFQKRYILAVHITLTHQGSAENRCGADKNNTHQQRTDQRFNQCASGFSALFSATHFHGFLLLYWFCRPTEWDRHRRRGSALCCPCQENSLQHCSP